MADKIKNPLQGWKWFIVQLFIQSLAQLLPELWKEPLRQIMMSKAIQELSMVKKYSCGSCSGVGPADYCFKKKDYDS